MPKRKDKQIYNLSLTKIVQKGRQLAEPVETVIIRAQKNFEIAGGLNPVQIETEYGRVLNILKNVRAQCIN